MLLWSSSACQVSFAPEQTLNVGYVLVGQMGHIYIYIYLLKAAWRSGNAWPDVRLPQKERRRSRRQCDMMVK